jgi:iron complex transport system permease protein
MQTSAATIPPIRAITPVQPRSAFPLLCALSLGAVLALVLAVCVGSIALTPVELWSAALSDADSLQRAILLNLRLPRALNSFALGGLLALAGVYMQVLLRNPLADPFIMGTSGGAAVAALGAMLLGLGELAISGAAAIGAFAAMLLVFALAHAEGSWSPTRLLLTGVVVAAGASAIVSLLLALGDEAQLRGMLFWLMGEVSSSTRPGPLWLLLGVVTMGTCLLARHLNVLARGELQAQALGLNVKQLRIALFAVSAVVTASAVTAAGTIGFIGLITPHLARLLVGADHRRMAPAAALLGGTLLTLADTAARTLFAPRQLPVGALTALIGVPIFLGLMLRKK